MGLQKALDYLAFGVGGGIAGAGGGAAYSRLTRDRHARRDMAIGAGLGAGAGLLASYLRQKYRPHLEDLSEGWYAAERTMPKSPERGLFLAHSGHLFVVPREVADSPKFRGYKRTDFVNKNGVPLSAISISMGVDFDKPRSMWFQEPCKISIGNDLTQSNGELLRRLTPIPLKKGISAEDALDALSGQVQALQSINGEPIYGLGNLKELPEWGGIGGRTNCHGFTSMALHRLSELHDLKDWAPQSGFSAHFKRSKKPKRKTTSYHRTEFSPADVLLGGLR